MSINKIIDFIDYARLPFALSVAFYDQAQLSLEFLPQDHSPFSLLLLRSFVMLPRFSSVACRFYFYFSPRSKVSQLFQLCFHTANLIILPTRCSSFSSSLHSSCTLPIPMLQGKRCDNDFPCSGHAEMVEAG